MDSVEKLVLEKLTFAEKLSSILEEVQEDNHVLQDVLKELIRKGMVATVVKGTKSHLAKTEIYYDSDHMHTYEYIITAKGLSALGH